jgi:hypothetical protein
MPATFLHIGVTVVRNLTINTVSILVYRYLCSETNCSSYYFLSTKQIRINNYLYEHELKIAMLAVSS